MSPSVFVVASFNLHAGVDGWGRPFDVLGACRALDADVVVLEETWTSDGTLGLAEAVGREMGYEILEHTLAEGRLAGPHPRANRRWMRSLDWRGASHAIYLDGNRSLPSRVTETDRYRQARTGKWGIAVLSRLPVLERQVIELGRLPRDRVRRAALLMTVDVDGQPVTVVGTHMSHLSYGSPRHFRRLNRLLDEAIGPAPAVLAGDMNLWGPPVAAFFGHWHRVVKGRTWPAWRPHSQVDHILARGSLEALGGEVLAAAGSDHRPVRAHLALP